MTEAQWNNLKPSQVLQACDDPKCKVTLVQQDELGRWIALVLVNKAFVSTCVLSTKPECWKAARA